MFYSMLHTDDSDLICVSCKTLTEDEDEYTFKDIDEMYTFDIASIQLGYYPNPSDIIYTASTSGLGIDKYKNFKAALRDFFNEMFEMMLYEADSYEREMIKRVLEKKFHSLKALSKLLSAIR